MGDGVKVTDFVKGELITTGKEEKKEDDHKDEGQK